MTPEYMRIEYYQSIRYCPDMKVTYEFDYFEEREELEKFQKALDYNAALWEISQEIRNFEKYQDPGFDAPLQLRYEKLYEAFLKIKGACGNYGIWET